MNADDCRAQLIAVAAETLRDHEPGERIHGRKAYYDGFECSCGTMVIGDFSEHRAEAVIDALGIQRIVTPGIQPAVPVFTLGAVTAEGID